MQVSPQGVQFIANQEGIVTRAYRDVAGVWTVGVGHTAAAGGIRPYAGLTITRDQAMSILADDLRKCEGPVTARLGEVPQYAYDGGVSFEFNTGAINRATWVDCYKAGDRAGTRSHLMEWVKAGGRTVAGLVHRRAAEADLILDGNYGGGVAIDIKDLQAKLQRSGFYSGPISGVVDSLTTGAVQNFQHAAGLVPDGNPGVATVTTLDRHDMEGKVLSAIPKAAGGGGATAIAASWQSAHPILFGLAVGGGIAVVIAGGFLLWHYRGAIGQWARELFTRKS